MSSGGDAVILLFYTIIIILAMSSMLGYAEPTWKIILLATLAYSMERTIFKSRHIFMWTSSILISCVALFGYLMHRQDKLGEILENLSDFLMVYTLSITETHIIISGLHEVVALLIFSFLVAAILHILFAKYACHFGYLVIALLTVICMSFMGGRVNNFNLKLSFLLLIIIALFHYFHHFYKTRISYKKAFKPMLVTVFSFIVGVVVIAQILYQINPDPLNKKYTQKNTGQDSQAQSNKKDALVAQYLNKSFKIEPSFTHNNTPIMKIKSQSVHYIKADTYEDYQNGIWLKKVTLAPSTITNIIDSNKIDITAFKKYYTLEDVVINIDHVKTNIVYTSAYGNFSTTFEPLEGDSIIFDHSRGTYFTNQELPVGYTYTLKAILPRYGTDTFNAFIDQYAQQKPPEDIINYALNIPNDMEPDIKALAENITRGVSGKYQKALAIERYLKKYYTYNETPPLANDNQAPILYFLFNSKEGFCQHFSSAMVLMLRSIDIPSRYVKGYYIEPLSQEDIKLQDIVEDNPLKDGYQTIYDANAHTWVEAYFPEVGWITLEPTPGRNYTYADNTDFEHEKSPLEQTPTPVLPQQKNVTYPVWIIVITLFMLLMIGLLLYIYHDKKRLKHLSINNKIIIHYKLIRLYYEAFSLKKDPFQTHREYATHIDHSVQPIYDLTLAALIIPYEALIYGEYDATEEDLNHFIAYLSSLKFYLKFTIGRWRYFKVRILEFFMI